MQKIADQRSLIFIKLGRILAFRTPGGWANLKSNLKNILNNPYPTVDLTVKWPEGEGMNSMVQLHSSPPRCTQKNI